MDDLLTPSGPLNQRLLSRLALPPELSLMGDGAPPGPAAPVMKVRERVAAAETTLCSQAEAVPGVDRDTVRRLLGHGETALRKLENEGAAAQLEPTEILGLEAVIEADGSRPVLPVQDGSIDIDGPILGGELGLPWRAAARERLGGIERVAASVGVVQLPAFDNMRIGTGFAIAPGLILTNRHVLEAVARFADGAWSWKFKAQIDFRGEHERGDTLAFDLDEVVLAGPDPIDNRVNFANLDFAVIRVRGDLATFPPALAFGDRVDAVKVTPLQSPSIYVLGFPVKPAATVAGAAAANEAPSSGTEFDGVLKSLFGSQFGIKRWAPGYVDAGAGQLASDAHNWVMSHDASTLGGNSGSCVVDFSGKNALVVGLHFGGKPRVENWAHVMAAIRDRFEGVGMQWSGAY